MFLYNGFFKRKRYVLREKKILIIQLRGFRTRARVTFFHKMNKDSMTINGKYGWKILIKITLGSLNSVAGGVGAYSPPSPLA